MSVPWITKFIVLRPDQEKTRLDEVFRTDDFQKAKYWLQYIAKPNDVLCATPLHPKHSAEGKPAYKSHKISSGSTLTDEGKWSKDFGTLSTPDSQDPNREFK